jgi:WD40 repeat protein
MAPEQLRADAAGAEVGEAADLYSLCATFYELFTGSRIYDHATTDAALVVTRKLQGEMPEAPRRLRAGLPWEIETIVNGGLQAEPADRYKSATALAEDLRRFLADEPILYRKPSLGRRAKLFARRNRSLVKLSAAFAALAIVGLVVSFIALATERGRTESARAKIEGAEKESKESKADAEAKGKQAIQAKREKLREVYSADMTAALQAWKANKPQEVRALLAKYDPRKVTATEDLRGFEWYYLDRLIDGGFRTLDFGGASRVVRFSPDGGHLAVLGTILHPQSMPDNALKIWKLPEGTLESTWLMGRVTNVMSHPAHKLQASPVKDQGLAYSPDGKLVAATCTFIRENQRDGLVKIWEAATGHEVFSTTDTAIGGRAVVFSPDGKYILAGGYDNAVLVYEVATSKLRWTLPSFTRPMMRNGNGEETDAIPRALLKQGFMDTYHYPVVFLNFVRQNNANKLDRASERWTRIDWPPDEEGQGPSSYGREFFYAKTSGGPALVMTVHNSSSQDWGLITEASRTSLKLIDLKFIQGPNPATQEAALASATNLSLGGGTIQSVAFGRWSGFAMGGSDGLVMAGHINPNTRIWEQPQMMRGHSGDVTGLAFSDDSQQLAAVGTSQITVWKYGGDQNTRPIAAIAESSDPVRKSTRTTDRVLSDLAKGGQGRWVLRQQDSDDPRMLEVVDASRHDEVLKSFPLPVTRASFSAITDDGRICAFAEGIEIGITARGLPKKAKQTGPIRVVDLRESVVAARTLDDSEAPHRIIQFQPGTHRILVTTQKSLRLMDADTGLEILAYNNTGTLPTGGNFSSDGRWFVTQHQNKMIKLWAVDRPEAAQTFEVPRESIWTFRPDGKRLCFPGPSDSIRVWDLENNRLDREFSNSGREVNALCFDPEGSRLITTGGDSITFWSIDTGEDIFSLPVGGSARDKSRDLGRKIAELQKRWQAEWAARAP